LLLGAGGAGGAQHGLVTLPLAGPVRELAADGRRVAILLRTKNATCARDRVAVWAPAARTFVPVGASACTASTSTGAGLFGVALAGTRVAYVQFAGGNARELALRLATLSRPRPVTVASAAFGIDEEQGTYIGRVAGDRSLLAFDWWSLCRPCAQVNPTGPRGAVWRIVPAGSACPQAGGLGAARRCAVVQSGLGRMQLLAVGGGRLALGAPDQSIVVRPAAGGPAQPVRSQPGEIRAVRIDSSGRLVVFLTRMGGRNALRVVEGEIAGALGRSYPLPAARTSGDAICGDPQGCPVPALRLEDVERGLAVYVLGRNVHVMRTSDGKQVTIRAPGSGPVHAQLEAPGLFYSYRPATSLGRGRVAFMPMADVLARFG
jgi:hypothetical protein